VKFAIVDYAYETTYPNLLGLVFATEEAGFLAGYASAAVTETGVVGTWGGINIPPVSAFMQGYLAGVNYHNAQKGTSVRVLGWDGNDGVFIGSFEAQDLGNAATRDMLQNGADIVMPVAGPAGLGAGTALQDFGSGKLVWVDTDGYVSNPSFASITFTSVEKRMDNAVFAAIKAVVDGNFEGGVYVGTVSNDGVGISSFHDFDGVVSAATKAELDEVISWLTGFDEAELAKHLEQETTFEDFFADARLNPSAELITGVICGVRVENIEDPLMQKIRYLDKLVDEVAKGKAMEKVLRG
jgi:basic membrane protein A